MHVDRDIVPDRLRRACQQVKWKNVIFTREDFVIVDNASQEALEIYFLDDRGNLSRFGFGEDTRVWVSDVISKMDGDDIEVWARQNISEWAETWEVPYTPERYSGSPAPM